MWKNLTTINYFQINFTFGILKPWIASDKGRLKQPFAEKMKNTVAFRSNLSKWWPILLTDWDYSWKFTTGNLIEKFLVTVKNDVSTYM